MPDISYSDVCERRRACLGAHAMALGTAWCAALPRCLVRHVHSASAESCNPTVEGQALPALVRVPARYRAFTQNSM